MYPFAWLDSFREVRTLGVKQYELTDHLGNVLVSALDKKTGYGNSISAGFHYYRGYSQPNHIKKLIMELSKFLVNNNYNNTIVDSIIIPENCIVFLYSSWSTSVVHLTVLIQYLKKEECEIPLLIFDIDHPEFQSFSSNYDVSSNGWGETYFLKNKNILLKIEKYSSISIDNQISKLVHDVVQLS